MKVRDNKNQKNNLRKGYLKLVPDKTYSYLKQMNNSDPDINKWSKRNTFRGLGFIALFILIGIFSDMRISVIGFIIALLDQRRIIKGVEIVFLQFKFERHIQFYKFERLLIPLLYETNSGVNLNGIFQRLVNRLPHEIDKKMLKKLITDMSYYNGSFVPFENFANQMSGTESSVLFMQTIYDLDQGALDLTIVNRLGKLASKEMMEGIDQIIAFKERRFNMLYTKIFTSFIVFMLGFSLSVVLFQVGKIGLFMPMK